MPKPTVLRRGDMQAAMTSRQGGHLYLAMTKNTANPVGSKNDPKSPNIHQEAKVEMPTNIQAL